MTTTRLGADSAHRNSNIVKLPTAAKRQVQQKSVRAIRAYRKENPWPGEYRLPFDRDAQRLAMEVNNSPELLMLVCMAKVLTSEQRMEFKQLVNLTSFRSPAAHTRIAAWLCDLI